MPANCRHHDLIKVGAAIYWLRLYEITGGFVSIVTEVPGNPARNTMNGLGGILKMLKDDFKVDLATLTHFEIWPSGYLDSETTIRRVDPFSPPKWHSTNRDVIEGLVGRLPPIPDHQQLLTLVGALGGRVREPIYRRVFKPVDVTSLPPPHNPSSCAYADRFQRIVAALPRTRQTSLSHSLKAGRTFLESLEASDVESCAYHHGNWKAIADESVNIIKALGTQDTVDPYLGEAKKRLSGRDRTWLESLFYNPIVVTGGTYTNGQHRGCALRFSGADRAAIVVGDEPTGKFEYPWTYRGDG